MCVCFTSKHIYKYIYIYIYATIGEQSNEVVYMPVCVHPPSATFGRHPNYIILYCCAECSVSGFACLLGSLIITIALCLMLSIYIYIYIYI